MREFRSELRIIAGSLKAYQYVISFRCADEEMSVDCAITADAVHDLMGFHRFYNTEDGALDAVLPEIERLVNCKFEAARLEQNGEVWIRASDLLRYGYQRNQSTLSANVVKRQCGVIQDFGSLATPGVDGKQNGPQVALHRGVVG